MLVVNKRIRSNSAASGSAHPPPKDDVQSSKKPRDPPREQSTSYVEVLGKNKVKGVKGENKGVKCRLRMELVQGINRNKVLVMKFSVSTEGFEGLKELNILKNGDKEMEIPQFLRCSQVKVPVRMCMNIKVTLRMDVVKHQKRLKSTKEEYTKVLTPIRAETGILSIGIQRPWSGRSLHATAGGDVRIDLVSWSDRPIAKFLQYRCKRLREFQ
ncbi:hypothetical protein Tco_0893367 [Tanacetum coccineum]|uniref:Uncharacterized protein n=1 Tax=Tanacetum coccineum TaxID=301880 RepID=A0ABQ5C8P5_9ASTR